MRNEYPEFTYKNFTCNASILTGYKVIPMVTIPMPEAESWGLDDLKKDVMKPELAGHVVTIIRHEGGTPLYAEFTADGMIHLGVNVIPIGFPAPMSDVAKVTMYSYYDHRNVIPMLGVDNFRSFGLFSKLLDMAKWHEPDEEKRTKMNDGGNKFVYVLEDYSGKTLCLKYHDGNLWVSTMLADVSPY